MHEVFGVCLDIAVALGQGCCLQYFLAQFLESRWNNEKLHKLSVIAAYSMGTLLLNAMLPSEYGNIRIFEKIFFTVLLLVLTALCFYKAAHTVTAFLATVFIAVSEIVFFLSNIEMQMGNGLFDLWVWLGEKGYIEYGNTFQWLLFLTEGILLVLFYGLYITLLFLSLRKIAKVFKEKDYQMQRTELYFLLAPSMAGLFVCTLLRIIMITVEEGMPKLLYDRYPVLFFMIPAILLLLLASIVYGIKLFQDMIALNREKSSRIVLEKQVETIQEHIEEMERIYSGIRSMKHDMKNTLSVVLQLAGQGEKQNLELQEYLAELSGSFDKFQFLYKTGNTVVDTLINMKYHEAVKEMPDIQIDAGELLLPDSLQIQNYDLGVIIGNALDNAVEGCKRLWNEQSSKVVYIKLSSFQKGRMFFLEVENSFDGKIRKGRQSEFPLTDKADKKSHGMGLPNIKSTAEKYHGAVDWSVRKNIFLLSVMLKNEKSKSNL